MYIYIYVQIYAHAKRKTTEIVRHALRQATEVRFLHLLTHHRSAIPIECEELRRIREFNSEVIPPLLQIHIRTNLFTNLLQLILIFQFEQAQQSTIFTIGRVRPPTAQHVCTSIAMDRPSPSAM